MDADALTGQARAVAAAHRLGMLAQGGEALAQLVDALTPYLAARPELARALAPVLGEVLAAQERGDPIGIADGLEFELVRELCWRA